MPVAPWQATQSRSEWQLAQVVIERRASMPWAAPAKPGGWKGRPLAAAGAETGESPRRAWHSAQKRCVVWQEAQRGVSRRASAAWVVR